MPQRPHVDQTCSTEPNRTHIYKGYLPNDILLRGSFFSYYPFGIYTPSVSAIIYIYIWIWDMRCTSPRKIHILRLTPEYTNTHARAVWCGRRRNTFAMYNLLYSIYVASHHTYKPYESLWAYDFVTWMDFYVRRRCHIVRKWIFNPSKVRVFQIDYYYCATYFLYATVCAHFHTMKYNITLHYITFGQRLENIYSRTFWNIYLKYYYMEDIHIHTVYIRIKCGERSTLCWWCTYVKRNRFTCV